MFYKKTSSSSLIDLAGQLYSPEDRHQYTKVILKKDRMMAQIEMIQSSLHHHYQQYKLEQQQQQQQKQNEDEDEHQPLPPPVKRKPTFKSPHPNVRHSMSSYSMLLSKSASMYQPKLLEQYDANHLSLTQIDMLSNQYNKSSTMEQLLMKKSPPSSSPTPASSIRSTQSNDSSLIDTSSTTVTPSLNLKTANLSDYHRLQLDQHLPLSPPLSPPTSSICLSTSSSTSYPISPKSTHLPSSQQTSYSSYLQKSTPASSTTSSQIPDITIDTKKISADLPSTPIASPIPHTIRQYNTISSNGNNSNSQIHFYYPSITHIQKNNGMRIRSFLGQSVVLNKTIRMEQHRVGSDSRFYQGKDEISGQAKVILKLIIIKSAAADQDDAMAPFGIHFENSAGPGGSTTLHAWIPDSLVLEALTVWLVASQLPHLLNACHVMRDGIKLYIVYSASAIY